MGKIHFVMRESSGSGEDISNGDAATAEELGN